MGLVNYLEEIVERSIDGVFTPEYFSKWKYPTDLGKSQRDLKEKINTEIRNNISKDENFFSNKNLSDVDLTKYYIDRIKRFEGSIYNKLNKELPDYPLDACMRLPYTMGNEDEKPLCQPRVLGSRVLPALPR